jgi:hypothetical protein
LTSKGVNIYLIFRLIGALIGEIMLLFSMDSVFLDSPLNEDGINQALELRHFILEESKDASNNIIQQLRGESGSSVIVSSTLRRAISTCVVGLWPRIELTGEKVFLLSCLQELGRNIDTQSLSISNQIADLPFNRVSPHCNKFKHYENFEGIYVLFYLKNCN